MEKPALDAPPAPTTAFVTLPDVTSTSTAHVEPPPPASQSWWTASASRRGQTTSARALVRLTSAVTDGDGGDSRHQSQTINEGTTSGRRLSDNLRSTRLMLRAVSSFLMGPSIIEKFHCYICFEDVPVAEAVTLSSCGHRFCKSCLQSYLTNQISDGRVHPVCFHPCEGGQNATPDDDTANTRQLTCGVAVADDQIQSIVHADVWTKFNKFRFNQKHQHARECPHCSFTQECAGPSNPSCVCSQCEKPFCFFHGNAHEYGTCSDYELKNAEAEALNRAVINKLAKPCPGCSRDIEKDGGCNHMTCVACQTSFCWLCGKEVESVANPSHFEPGNEGSCSGKQFDEQYAEPTTPWWAILVDILAYPLMFPVALLLTPFVWICSRDETILEIFQRTFRMALYWFGAVLGLVLVVLFSVIEFVVSTIFELIGLIIIGTGMLLYALFEAYCCRRRNTSEARAA